MDTPATTSGIKKGERVRVVAGTSAGMAGVVESVEDEQEFRALVRIYGEPAARHFALEDLEPDPGPSPPTLPPTLGGARPATLDIHGRPCNGCFGHGRVTVVSVRDRETGLWDQPFELRSARYYHESDEVRRGFRACPYCDGTGSGPVPEHQS